MAAGGRGNTQIKKDPQKKKRGYRSGGEDAVDTGQRRSKARAGVWQMKSLQCWGQLLGLFSPCSPVTCHISPGCLIKKRFPPVPS